MSEVRTEVTMINIGAQNDAKRGDIPLDQVRRLTVNAAADTGAWTRQPRLALIINEETREKPGLLVEKTGEGTVPGRITEPIRVYWQNRRTTCEAVVFPGEEDILLGTLPLEGMDLMVHPLRQEVIGTHGDRARSVVKRTSESSE
jgi:hypothetical protein